MQANYTQAQLTYASFIRYRKKIYGNLITNPPSEPEISQWINQAATKDNIAAQLLLEVFYLDSEEYDRAFALATPMAKKGYAGPQYVLGTMYYYGLGTKIDYSKALYWYQKALQHDPPLQKNSEIMGNLSEIYTKPGFKNPEKAVYWKDKMEEFENKINQCQTH